MSTASSSSLPAGGSFSSEPFPVRDRLEAFNSDFDPSCGAIIEAAVASLDPTLLRCGATATPRSSFGTRTRRCSPHVEVIANLDREVLANGIMQADMFVGLRRIGRTRTID